VSGRETLFVCDFGVHADDGEDVTSPMTARLSTRNAREREGAT
jgi:hypothetical protein